MQFVHCDDELVIVVEDCVALDSENEVDDDEDVDVVDLWVSFHHVLL